MLQPHARGYRPFDARFHYLFNSYYEALGPRHPRPQRGLLTRPSLDEVHAYRAHVDAAMAALARATPSDATWAAVEPLVELGLHHEQQHQELLLTDILHALSCNPLLPAYRPQRARRRCGWRPRRAGALAGACRAAWSRSATRGEGFAFDNETPRHRVLLQPYRDRRPAGDLRRLRRSSSPTAATSAPALWLSDGWAAVQAQGWQRAGLLARARTIRARPPAAAGRCSACTACGRWTRRRRWRS